ncbi:unnamed protein product [Lepeophtheirus salmonis]|uniref:(salmon louse) hypothetical protein n=1 Tax=Lepeophtheirus salmonis TaxID=72036 RepID=A0A7R8CUN5_LEPSM|nr:unnamed protein product [Lepeophtheirus salmonis]CAF2936480.1 unnamed protein product [Lepeophtheirus salmonis]
MKFLVLSTLLAVASASYLVSHPNGAVVPADTPAIAHAKAQHFAAKGHAHGGAYAHGPVHGHAHHAAPHGHGYAHGAAAYPAAGYTPLVSHPNGAITPADTPDVAAAKAAHVAAGGAGHYAAGYPYAHGPAHHGAAHHGLAHHGPAHHGAAHFGQHGGYAGGYNGLVAHPNGAVVPVESPENQAARAHHFAAHAKAY